MNDRNYHVNFLYKPYQLRPTWMEIDLDHVIHNITEIRRIIGNQSKLIAVAKFDAYGHGVEKVVPIMFEAGADIVAVGNLKDAIKIRETGCQKPILLFGSCLPNMAEPVIAYNIIPTLWDVYTANVYSRLTNKPMEIYLKIDTGFARIGVLPDQAVEVAKGITDLPHLHIECAYTHMADPLNEDFTRNQFNCFIDTVEMIRSAGVEIPYACAAPSAIISQWTEMLINAVDPGRLVYGFYLPSPPAVAMDLLPVARAVKSRFIQIKWVKEGESVGYGRKFFANRPTRVGILPLGWSDGLMRNATEGVKVLVRGKRCPFIGAVSLEHSLIDLTDLDIVEIGDEAVIIGEQGGERITQSEHAQWLGISELEVIAHFGKTVPRVYYKDRNELA